MPRSPWPTFQCGVAFDVEHLIEKKKKKAVTLSTPKCVYNPGLKIEWHSCHMFPCVTSIGSAKRRVIETFPANWHHGTLNSQISFFHSEKHEVTTKRKRTFATLKENMLGRWRTTILERNHNFQKTETGEKKIPASGHLPSESTEFSSGSSHVVVWISSSSSVKSFGPAS